ncbi:MAG: DUF362 domain-containing protein [Acidobacteriota bacterium]
MALNEVGVVDARVSVARVRGNVRRAVRDAMEAAQWRRFITPGADVALKVNLGWDLFVPGSITSPWVVEGVIETIREYVGQVFVVESDQVLVSSERALRNSYIDRVCRKHNVPFVNMSKGRFAHVKLDGALALHEMDVPEILHHTELITIPVMKTHNKTTITGSIKNQWGCLDKLRHNFHPVVNEALVDINRAARPRFAVLDATVSMEGDAPKSGRPRVTDLVMASGDFVALEAVQAKVMGFDPAAIPHIQNCARHGLGVADLSRIEQAGDGAGATLSPAFVPAGHNLVSYLELVLRRSWLRRAAFDTPLFDLCRAGAILYYLAWYYLVKGRSIRDSILAHPVYGAQWRDEAWLPEPGAAPMRASNTRNR